VDRRQGRLERLPLDEKVAAADALVDGLSAILLPYLMTLELAIVVAAPRRELSPAGVARLLAGTAGAAAIMITAHPAALVALWVLTAVPTWRATRSYPGGRQAARVYALMMTAAVGLMAAGTVLLVADQPWRPGSGWVGATGGWLVAVAVMIRKGIVPFHSWYPALFRGASPATALSATMPQVASCTAIRLLVGHADGVPYELVALSQAAVVTAAYGAALAVVQRDVRGLVGTLAMSQSALVLAGLSGSLPLELCGALAIWISSGLALTGIALVAWSLESRGGPIAIDRLGGRFTDAPALAAFFLLFGLASLGLPGSFSFVAIDLIVAGSLGDRLHGGVLVIIATSLAGLAVMRGWFRIFGGVPQGGGPRHPILAREQVAFAGLLVILFALGVRPGPVVRSLERIAASLLESSSPSAGSIPSGDHP
jgi:NADH-quinone oxidoreductase subunit M